LKLNSEVKVKQQDGKKATAETFNLLPKVEIDHNLLDSYVIDGKTGSIIGRPCITVVTDVFSRAILLMYISSEEPSSSRVKSFFNELDENDIGQSKDENSEVSFAEDKDY
jgi:hypothetical protein